MNAFITYCRVSSKMQGRSGLGLEAQAEAVSHFVKARSGTIVGQYCEVESGAKTDAGRPQLALALGEAKRLGATLVVAKLDRLSRNAEFLLKLQNSGVDFVCADCPNVDKFTCGILALVAQRERELISERTKAALRAAKARGTRLGNPNKGSQLQNMWCAARKAKEDFRAATLPVLREVEQTGVKTLQGLADCLNRRGIPTRTGKGVWFPSSVRAVLSSK